MANDVSIYGQFDGLDEGLNYDTKDIIVPELRLMQAKHPFVEEGKVSNGDFVDMQSQRSVWQRKNPAVAPVKVVPVFQWKHWIEWNPNKNAPKNKKIIERSSDPNSRLKLRCDKQEMVTNSEGKPKAAITEYFSYLVLVPEYFQNWNDIMVINFGRSAWKAGKEFLNRLRSYRLNGNIAPIGATMWGLSTKIEKNDAQDTFNVPVIGDAELVPAEAIPTIVELRKKISEQKNAYMKVLPKEDDESLKNAEVVSDDSVM